MSMKTNTRTACSDNQKLHSNGASALAHRAPRNAKAKRAPRRIWATNQMQQGATMAYQQGFTSGPLS
jgi:hypothetical protein